MKTILATAALLLTAQLAAAATYTVTTTADSGSGSLRQAILEANSGKCAAPCRIDFVLGEGYHAIAPQTALPIITASDVSIRGPQRDAFSPQVIIDGSSAGFVSGLKAVDARKLEIFGLGIINFQGHGIFIDGGSDVLVQDCAIGTDHRNKAAAPNGLDGIAGRNVDRIRLLSNFIDSNGGNGIYMNGCTRAAVVVNEIGKGWYTGEPRPNNGFGVFMDNCDGLIANNGIAFNKLSGVAIVGARSRVEVDLFNRIHDNGGLGVDLGNDGQTPNDELDEDSGPNDLLNTPVITRALKSLTAAAVEVTLHTRPFENVFVNLFTSDPPNSYRAGQGRSLLAFKSGQTDAEGRISFTFQLQNPPEFITASAHAGFRDPDGRDVRTSEFTQATPFSDAPLDYLVTTTADEGAGSLRQALLDANAAPRIANLPAVIRFAIPAAEGIDNVLTITPRAPLPPIANANLVIDGESQGVNAKIGLNGANCAAPCNGIETVSPEGASGTRIITNLVINGFPGHGVAIRATSSTPRGKEGLTLSGCFIGTDASGTIAVPNGGNGIDAENAYLDLGATWSHTVERFLLRPAKPNVISGNRGDGIHIVSSTGRSYGTLLGVAAVTHAPLGNGGNGMTAINTDKPRLPYPWGAVFVFENGEVAYNGGNGIDETGGGAVAIRSTSVHDNADVGKDLGQPGPTDNDAGDADAWTNFPVITSATYDATSGRTTITGTISTITTSSLHGHISVFASRYPDASGRGEGASPIDNLTITPSADGTTAWTMNVDSDLRGQFVTATWTLFDWFIYDYVSATSEFSPAVQVTTTACGSLPVAIPTAPAAAAVIEANKPVTFTWSDAAAASYVLWVRPLQQAAVAQQATTERTTTLTLPAGDYEWFVESKFNGCYSTYSVPQKFSVK